MLVLGTPLSLALLVRLGVLRALPLAMSPRRESELTFLHFVAAVLLYVGFVAMAATLVSSVGGATPPAPATAATSPVESFDFRARLIDDVARLATFAMVVAIAAHITRHGLRGFGLALGQIPRGILLGLLAFAIIFPLINLLENGVVLFDHFLRGENPVPVHPLLQMIRNPATPLYGRIMIILSAAVIAPLVEELVFRGVLQTGLQSILRPRANAPAHQTVARAALRRWLIIVAATIPFTAMHWNPTQANWIHFPVLGLLSLALGYVYERTGNLWASMTLHAAFNSASLAVVVLAG